MIKQCVYCGLDYQASRSTSKYCSTSCKHKYHALPKVIQEDGSIAVDGLKRLAIKARRFPARRNEVLNELKKINSLSSALASKIDKVGRTVEQ